MVAAWGNNNSSMKENKDYKIANLSLMMSQPLDTSSKKSEKAREIAKKLMK